MLARLTQHRYPYQKARPFLTFSRASKRPIQRLSSYLSRQVSSVIIHPRRIASAWGRVFASALLASPSIKHSGFRPMGRSTTHHRLAKSSNCDPSSPRKLQDLGVFPIVNTNEASSLRFPGFFKGRGGVFIVSTK